MEYDNLNISDTYYMNCPALGTYSTRNGDWAIFWRTIQEISRKRSIFFPQVFTAQEDNIPIVWEMNVTTHQSLIHNIYR